MATKKNLAQAAQAATDHFFTGAAVATEDRAQDGKISTAGDRQEGAQAAQEGHQEDRPGKSSGDETKAVRGRKKGTGEPVKVFSFRAAVGDVDQWRLYAAIKGDKVDDIGAAAMREYVKRHPLRDEEKALFDKRIESMKS